MKRTFLYNVAKIVCPVLFAVYAPLKVVRKTELPEGKRVMICCNHLSMLDPLAIGVIHKRQVHYMGKAELFKNKFLGAMFKAMGGFPIVRGARDTEALNTAGNLLQNDRVVGIFIEGTRSKTGELLRPKTGAAMLAYQNDTPILPMCITGPDNGRIKPFRKIYVSCGDIVTPKELGITEGTGIEFRAASRAVMDKIAEMREEHLMLMGLPSQRKAAEEAK